jgi:formate dehydrogenase major subunit/formate dehydrogenase alpha subunit
MSRGRLCIKGWLAHEFVHHPERLKYPLIRDGEIFQKASWDMAYSALKEAFTKIKQEHGADALAVLTSAKATNEENFAMMKFARLALGTNNVDHVARLCHAPTLVGLGEALGTGSMTNPISSLKESDCILVIGSNTTEQHPLVASYILEACEGGASLIVADPRRSQLALRSKIYLSPYPGSDISVLNCFLNIAISEGKIDGDFISNRTTGFQQVSRMASDYSPKIVSKMSGIPEELLITAAMEYCNAKRASIVYAMGITQHTCGTDNVQAIANLALATGNIGRPGTGIYPLRGHQNVQGACDMGALPNFYSGYQKLETSREKFEEAWSSSLPNSPGLTAVELMNKAKEGEVKGMIIFGENPMISYPDQKNIRAALQNLEFLAVADIFPTLTTELAHVVFPACSFAEKCGTNTSTERRIQMVRRAISPIYESKPDWLIVSELLRCFGHRGYESPEEIMSEISKLTPSYGGISHERLGICGLQWPCPSVDHSGTQILHETAFPIGRAKFRAVIQDPLYESVSEEYPLLLTTGRLSYHFHTGTMTRRVPLLEREQSESVVQINPMDASTLQLREGNQVEVESKRGVVRARIKLSQSMPQGIVFMPFHFSEGPANALTSSTLDKRSKMPSLKISAVRIKKVV